MNLGIFFNKNNFAAGFVTGALTVALIVIICLYWSINVRLERMLIEYSKRWEETM